MERRLRLDPTSGFTITSAAAVRARIARLILGEQPHDATLGSVKLHPHQLSAVERLQSAIYEFNGALLSDDVGMGKTYVAIAVARQFDRKLLVAPAALGPMWQDALGKTGVDAEFMTFEALSRADVKAAAGRSKIEPQTPFDLVVIDEAHHVRNPRTNRYFALESIVRGARVLLLSATPVHNRRADLAALLGLFLGSRAHALTSAELALCVIRREQQQIEHAVRIPVVLPTVYHEVSDDPSLVEQLMDLPPPVPLRGGGVAAALIGRSLVHQLASSEAALNEAVKRRIARAAALCASLEAGTYPTGRELETWIYGEGALQLGFAELLSAPIVEHEEMLVAIRTHLGALEKIRIVSSAASTADSERAQIVASVRSTHPGSSIVAFAQYAETVSMLFRRLVRSGGAGMLTSHGARVAGGSLTRSEAIARFAPRATGKPAPSVAETIDLLLTTDLLSEGVNLQDGDVVIHLDTPWTVARMEQRVGRLARLGSLHHQVAVHALRPPYSAEQVLRSESIVQRKWWLAKASVGTSAHPPVINKIVDPVQAETESTPQQTERLRGVLETWLSSSGEDRTSDATLVATVEGRDSGFVAATSIDTTPYLLAGRRTGVSTDIASQIDLCTNANRDELTTDVAAVDLILEMIREWYAREQASLAAGLNASSALHRGEITRRIDACVESAPPHLRASRLMVAGRARRIAVTPQCAAVERDLNVLAHSDLPADAWLEAIARLASTTGPLKTSPTGPLRIHAILILRERT